jgi:uncharacterized protein
MAPAPLSLDADAPLPPVIPIFPLTGAILLPHAQLPLNIFEPRYLAMVRDAMAGARLIGMVQPKDQAKVPGVYTVGGLGRITSYSETDDGRFLITLTCLTRFAIAEELSVLTPYRQVRADYAPFHAGDQADTVLASDVRSGLVADLKAYLAARGLGADWEAVGGMRDDILVNALAMLCPFEPEEKQALLEAGDVAGRAEMLRTLMGFALRVADAPVVKH